MIEAHTPAYTLEPTKLVVENNQPSHPRTPNFINDIAAGKVELTSRRTGESEELAPEAALARCVEIYAAVV